MNQSRAALALDVGEKRIGVAVVNEEVMIARPLTTVSADGDEIENILKLADQLSAAKFVIGYPRNQAGEPTAQTASVESFSKRLSEASDIEIAFQDESLTSVLAEERLRSYGKPYSRADIDAMAATLILQDYLEINNGRI